MDLMRWDSGQPVKERDEERDYGRKGDSCRDGLRPTGGHRQCLLFTIGGVGKTGENIIAGEVGKVCKDFFSPQKTTAE